MKIVRHTRSLAAELEASVVTIGNFDGVHLGHQAMLRLAREQADRLGAPLVVITFDPHPEEFFAGDKAPSRVMSVCDRSMAIAGLGADALVVFRFDAHLANMNADTFVQQILVSDLKAQCLIVGDDFRYGKGRGGNVDTLKSAGQALGFEVRQLPTVTDDAARISSTRVREALNARQLDVAEQVLGRPYRISGRVVHGDKRGRDLGFPTINLRIRHQRPLSGVFVVRVNDADGVIGKGVANLGIRPTVGGLKRLLEVHLFDFDADLYGRRVCVDFLSTIREEKKFESFDALVEQIAFDKQAALTYFNLPSS